MEYFLESGNYWNTLHFIGILYILYTDFKKNVLDSDFQTFGLLFKDFLHQEYCQILDIPTGNFMDLLSGSFNLARKEVFF